MMLTRLAAERRVILCAGGGGVGKTTVAAALALAGARAGRRAVVITVDPARRLADALGVDGLGDEPRPVRVPDLPPGGALDAAMLDQKRAWDTLVARHAPTPEAAARLLAHPIYRQLSASFAGTHEYLAVDQLCGLVDAGKHDLVVLDTPPAAQAAEIFDAPARLRGFLDRRLLRLPLRPLVGRMARFFLAQLQVAVGVRALGEASDFFVALSGLFDGFDARARQLERLLALPSTALLLIVAPDARALGEAELLGARAAAIGVRPAAVVVNRAHASLPDASAADVDATLRAARLDGWLAAPFLGHQRLVTAESRVVQELRRRAREVVVLPALEEDVHDLGGLGRLVRRR